MLFANQTCIQAAMCLCENRAIEADQLLQVPKLAHVCRGLLLSRGQWLTRFAIVDNRLLFQEVLLVARACLPGKESLLKDLDPVLARISQGVLLLE